jgi:Tfp pilus assembly protein PilE
VLPTVVLVGLFVKKPSRSAFSFLEVAVTLLLLSLLLLVGFVSYDRVRENTEGAAAAPLLSVAQLEARRLTDVSGEFPESLEADLSALSDSELATTSGAASDGVVSVYRVDEQTLVLAARSGDDCLVLLDRVSSVPTWAKFLGLGLSCQASLMAAEVTALAAGGSPASPLEVE